MMGINQPVKKREAKNSQKHEENKDISANSKASDYNPSDSDDTETVNLLPSDSEEEKIVTTKTKAKKKNKFKHKKTAAQKAAIEENKRKDAENIDRGIHIVTVDSGIRITKTRKINDTEVEEIVEIDPTIKEIRPKVWKYTERELENKNMDVITEELMKSSPESNLLYINDSATTGNRNIIRAALTDNAELAKLCIEETSIISSLMESWSPELKSTALELCISHNSRKVLELLLKTCKQEEAKTRESENKLLIKRFDTGQVDDRAFGTRVRKVEMMRGGRQGNNAFMQDNHRKEEYKSIFEQFTADELLTVRAAYSCNIGKFSLFLSV